MQRMLLNPALLSCSIQRQSDKVLKKLEARDKRRGRGGDADVDWLVSQQAEALHILAGAVLFSLYLSFAPF